MKEAMKKILIIYSTTDGHTKLICEKIKMLLSNTFKVDLYSMQNMKKNIELLNTDFVHVIVGASIRYGKHSDDVYDFIKNNIDFLESSNNSFFSVNVVARKPEKNSPETNPYIKKFLTLSNWSPKKLAVFAGKVDYPKYRFIDKYMIRLIMWITNGPTDVSKTYEFTDWNKVEEFAHEIEKISC
tara:strand:- start:2602 stop:3153 length:552 start_codon:yes stop_codon:yes gene_type:complete